VGAIVGVPPEMMADFTESMLTVLRLMQVPVATRDAAVKADVEVKLGPAQDSGRPVTLTIALADGGSGNVLRVVQMNSMLVEPVSREQWQVLGEAAIFRIADILRQLLGGPRAMPSATR
jgi:hypothetical protein